VTVLLALTGSLSDDVVKCCGYFVFPDQTDSEEGHHRAAIAAAVLQILDSHAAVDQICTMSKTRTLICVRAAGRHCMGPKDTMAYPGRTIHPAGY
jgi:hypothetical protein